MNYCFNSHLAPGRTEWCLKGKYVTTIWKVKIDAKLHTHGVFLLNNLPGLQKEAVNQLHPTEQEQELQGPLTGL